MKWVKIIAFVAIVIALIGGGVWYNNRADKKTAEMAAKDAATAEASQEKIMAEFKKEDVVAGTGAEAKAGDVVSVNYVGTLDNGQKFDSSYDRGTPFEFTLGAEQVIQGWDLGIVGMKIGGKRNLTIPPELGYGAEGAGGVIPPNATLHFTVELVGIKK